MIKEKTFAVDKSKPYILVTTLHVLELFVKDILTLNDPISSNETRLYFLEIHAKLTFEEADCEVLPWRSSVAVFFKDVNTVQGYFRNKHWKCCQWILVTKLCLRLAGEKCRRGCSEKNPHPKLEYQEFLSNVVSSKQKG